MMPKNLGRRGFLKSFTLAPALGGWAAERPGGAAPLPSRIETALAIRDYCAAFQLGQPAARQASNADETSLPGYIGNFSKGLPHDQSGVVNPSAYGTLLYALSTEKHADFEAIARGSGMKLVDPQSAFAYEMEGADSHRFACLPAPCLTSAQAAAEMAELYWQALARDLPFADYAASPLIQAAGRDLASSAGFQGPRSPDGNVPPELVFQANFPGVLTGPYISQFLWKPIPTLSTWVEQRYRVPVAGMDFLTDYAEWVLLQSGLPPYRTVVFDGTPRYLCTGRGLAEWVHYDFLYQAFHNAALILLNQAPETVLDTNPYYSPTNPYKTSKIQTGFATFGAPHVCSWLGRLATAALQAAWYQKWSVHRRLRPEEFGGLIHETLTGTARYPVPPDLLRSPALATTFEGNSTYLLPQAFPEGCPLHPAYPAGHATVAGACSALLKCFFDESGLITDCVVANADGSALLPYDGALTVGGEINKLAWNIAIGRNFAGIHYRSDAIAGFRLGEDIAIAKLQDLVNILTEDFPGFQFTRLDGTPVQITKQPEATVPQPRPVK